MERKKKKFGAKRIPLSHLQEGGSIPESNVINLRELMLQKEVERLRLELEQRKKGSVFGKLKSLTSSKQKKTSVPIPSQKIESVELPPPTTFTQPATVAPRRVIRFTPPQIRIGRQHLKSLSAFMAVSLGLILLVFGLWWYQRLLDVRSQVLAISIRAFDQLVLAGEATTQSDYNAARARFAEASDTFLTAQRELDRIGATVIDLLRFVPLKGKQLSSGEHLLAAGQAIALAGQDITQAIQAYNPEIAQNKDFLIQNNITDLLATSQEYLGPARDRLALASEHLNQVDADSLPAQYRTAMERVKDGLPQLQQQFDQFLLFGETFRKLLGGDGSKRYLMIFQNNREMRATGGFIGSLALVDIDHGTIKKIEVPGGGPYDFQGQLTEQVISPTPLHLVNPHWFLQDANWFPDFPTSAKKVMWFYEKCGGPTVDGVISLTPEVVINLLKISGSIDLQDKYGVTITSENFIDETLNQVEQEYDKEANKPKQFIADLLPILLQRIFEGGQKEFFTNISTISDALERRDILFYIRDEALQANVVNLGWAGEIKRVSGDYLMLVNTNISGGKTDAVIDQTISHQLTIGTDGQATATVEITRVHNGKGGDQWSGVKNIDFMRLYVPAGSELIEATGFAAPDPKLMKWPDAGYQPDTDLTQIEGQAIIDERSNTRINNEFGKTVFGNWVQVEPGQSATVRFVYRLPFLIKPENMVNYSFPYSLFIQRQAGSFDALLRSQISYPDGYQVVWQWPDEQQLQNDSNKLTFEKILDRDYYLGTIFQIKK